MVNIKSIAIVFGFVAFAPGAVADEQKNKIKSMISARLENYARGVGTLMGSGTHRDDCRAEECKKDKDNCEKCCSGDSSDADQNSAKCNDSKDQCDESDEDKYGQLTCWWYGNEDGSCKDSHEKEGGGCDEKGKNVQNAKCGWTGNSQYGCVKDNDFMITY